MKIRSVFALSWFLASGFLCSPLLAQQTGTIHGTITDRDGLPLPGVVVTLVSPSLQGTRNAVSSETGQFLVRLLPPGHYRLTASLPGLTTKKLETRVAVASTNRVRIQMEPEGTVEVLTVTADRVAELDSTQVATNFDDDFLEKLPRNRSNLEGVAKLAPGVNSGAFGGVSINGAVATENLFLLNGTLINSDNIRGRADDLFIEDDIEETQIISGNASAEFGFFSGGVVNTITKSGSNEFHGTFRTEVTNNSWTARNPIQLRNDFDPTDTVNKEYTLVFNGPIIKDRLWFAFSGRNFDTDSTFSLYQPSPMSDEAAISLGLEPGQTAPQAEDYNYIRERDRFQLKLTGTLAPGHTLIASYLKDEDTVFNRAVFSSISRSALSERDAWPTEMWTLNYRGIITPEFTIDANFGDRSLTNESGIITDDRVLGTTVVHRDQGWTQSNAPFGNGEVINERASRNWNVKFSYFLNGGFGTHDMTFGVQEVTDMRNEDNHQSATGWSLYPRWTRFEDNEVIGIYTGTGTSGGSAWLVYWPVVNPSKGSDFNTRAVYFNDVWTINPHWYMNLGLRYDRNDTSAEDGQELSKTDNISPRFTLNYDVHGDGVHQFSAGYNKYTGKINDAAQSGSTAGSPAAFYWRYDGPQTESIADVFAWIDANFPGGLAGVESLNRDSLQNEYLFYQNYSPDTSYEALAVVPQEGGLDATSVTEISLGYKHKLGNRGYLKADLIRRDYDDFLVEFIDRGTGQTSFGVDRSILSNDSDHYDRDYLGISLAGQYSWANQITLGGNYTWSEAEGNINGETSGAGGIATSRTTAYPEFNHPRLNPTRRLPESSEHDLNLWASYDLNTGFGDFNFTLLHTWTTGLPYGIGIDLDIESDPTAFGFPSYDDVSYYNSPPTSVWYWATAPDAFKWEDTHATDIAVNYALKLRSRLEFFLQMEVLNVMNNDAQIDGNSSAYADGFEAFDVFSDTPQEGVHYQTATNFGEAQYSSDYQYPRTFRFDIGIKF
ncbi:TonB-dependent receptor [Sulfidibacter corallicola]|uniref:TonB-dependent receptor n=1 Tax=Sulfidibacter corallicola TaxID=2818388 RepID=A0A8A4TUV7_SULCO|nr:TonB-dependent receptor [Sulfidibacter corallicola]QTD53263.1 TonB-dependent receptor [Sulfidibacter corallicola]